MDGHHDYNHKFPRVLESLPHPVALLNPKDELCEMTFRSLDYLQNATSFDLPDGDWGPGYRDVRTDKVTEFVCEWRNSDAEAGGPASNALPAD